MAYKERKITSKPKFGEMMPVETPTHVTGTIDFKSGAIGTLIMSFDTFTAVDYPNIEIYGTEGTLRVPDPNMFGGEVKLRKPGEKEWKTLEHTHTYDGNCRGVGVLDLAVAIRQEREHRANGHLALHVLEAMYGFHAAAETGKHYRLKNDCEPPEPLPEDGISSKS